MFQIDEEKQFLHERRIAITNGASKKYLTLKIRDLTMDEAAQLVDSHVADIEKNEESDSLSSTEAAAAKRIWLANALLENENLQEWDVVMKGQSEAVEISKKTVDALIDRGQVFYPVYKDFIDLITKITHGISNTEVRNEIKNFRK